MERPDRTLRIFLEIVEERRVEAVLDAFEDREMQLEQIFDGIEDAANDVCFRISGHLLHVAVGHEIKVELGTDPLDDLGQPER